MLCFFRGWKTACWSLSGSLASEKTMSYMNFNVMFWALQVYFSIKRNATSLKVSAIEITILESVMNHSFQVMLLNVFFNNDKAVKKKAQWQSPTYHQWTALGQGEKRSSFFQEGFGEHRINPESKGHRFKCNINVINGGLCCSRATSICMLHTEEGSIPFAAL